MLSLGGVFPLPSSNTFGDRILQQEQLLYLRRWGWWWNRDDVFSLRCLALAHACCKLVSCRQPPHLYRAALQAMAVSWCASKRLLGGAAAVAAVPTVPEPWSVGLSDQGGSTAPCAHPSSTSHEVLGIWTSLPASAEPPLTCGEQVSLRDWRPLGFQYCI